MRRACLLIRDRLKHDGERYVAGTIPMTTALATRSSADALVVVQLQTLPARFIYHHDLVQDVPAQKRWSMHTGPD